MAWSDYGYGTDAYNEAKRNPGIYTLDRLRQLQLDPRGNEGHQDWANNTALLTQFQSMYGRNPTQQEINRLSPYYTSDPILGAQVLQSQFDQYKKSPEYIKSQSNYGDNLNSVNEQFKSLLGRDATNAEKEHFGQLLGSGELDNYQLGTFLQQLPEYVNAQDKKFREDLTPELQNSQANYFKEYIQPGIVSQNAQRGIYDSSGIDNAFAQAAKQQNYDMQDYLSKLSASQYGSNRAAALQDYQTNQAQRYGQQNMALSNLYNTQNWQNQQAQDISNYNMQKNAYDQYIKNYGKRSNGLGGLLGGSVGGLLGAYFGGPAGASVGYGIGSGFGNAAQTYAQGY